VSGPERVIFGFHTVLARLRAEPKSVLEVFLDETRKDARAKDFAAQVERAGARLMRDIMNQPNMQPFIARELTPLSSDADIDGHIRNTAITLHHPLGTCKMGRETDDTAVVDAQLRVRGVECLRVIDASVMPDLISGNINAPVMMIAEKAADMIRSKPTLAPLNS